MSNKSELQSNNVDLQEVLDAINELPDMINTLSANDITEGTFAGMVKANDTAMAEIAVSQVRNIILGSEDIEAGTASTEPEGSLHFIFE